MIIYFSSGQLGNQIFQYEFLNGIRKKKEKVITSKCEYFDIFDYKKSEYIFLNKYLRFIVRRISNLLIKLQLATLIIQKKKIINNESVYVDDYMIYEGLLKFIKIVEGFYQSEKFITSKPIVREKYIKKKGEYLKDIPSNMSKVFVHVRRGDYTNWKILGKKNPSLSLAYYKSAIIQLQHELKNPFFIFLSNDSEYIENEFHYLENKKISTNEVAVDLAIMQSCENAIISNSTLSWWGIYLMQNKNIILGPKYWLGWQSEIWYPVGIKLSDIKYMTVKDYDVNK